MKFQKIILILFVACTAIIFPLSLSAEESSAAQLRAQCEEERELRLAPLREKEIEECVKNRSSREDCERKFSDLGESGRTASGGFRARMFDDLPACVAAREAEISEEAAARQEQSKGEGHRDTKPDKSRDSSAGTKSRDTEPGKKRDTESGKKRDTK